MAMRVSDAGLAEIASHEGIVPYPYYDSAGVLTVGVGHTASAGPPNPAELPKGVEIPMKTVMDTFRRDITTFEARVNRFVTVPLKQHEFDALVSFDLNTGGIQRANLTRRLNAGDRAGAAAAFMGWSKPPEIIPRREKEQALFRDGKYSSGGKATVYRASASGAVLWSTGKSVDVLAVMGKGDPPSPAPLPRPKPTPIPPTPAPKPETPPSGLLGALLALFKALFGRK